MLVVCDNRLEAGNEDQTFGDRALYSAPIVPIRLSLPSIVWSDGSIELEAVPRI